MHVYTYAATDLHMKGSTLLKRNIIFVILLKVSKIGYLSVISLMYLTRIALYVLHLRWKCVSSSISDVLQSWQVLIDVQVFWALYVYLFQFLICGFLVETCLKLSFCDKDF